MTCNPARPRVLTPTDSHDSNLRLVLRFQIYRLSVSVVTGNGNKSRQQQTTKQTNQPIKQLLFTLTISEVLSVVNRITEMSEIRNDNLSS